jgi:multiple sugar transport system ATP-binding protein
MARVSLKNVSKIYPGKNGRDVTAVNELQLDIQDRECVVLLGPPNCGISSIVRMVAGLEDISRGDIFIGDRRVNDVRPKERDVAIVSQNYAPYPGMSVRDHLGFGLKRREFSNAEMKKRVLEAAEILGLQELLERKPESLSAEQCQRVAIAHALALQPKVFLLDEPLANLEAERRAQLRHDIAKLHHRLQATMVYVTHEPIEAMALGCRIIVLNDGAIQQDGTAQTLYDEPANVFVGGFVGSPPMNFIRGMLKQDREWLLFSEVDDGAVQVRLPVSEFLDARDFGAELVILGIRPEDIEVADVTKTTGKHTASFPAIIDRVEPIGRGANLYLQTGAHTVVCRSQRSIDDREAGHRSKFTLNIEKVCLFDPVSSRRIG